MNTEQTIDDPTGEASVSRPPFSVYRDRRHGARSPLVLDLLVYYRHVPVGRARTRNLSLKGACVETRHRLTLGGPIVQLKLSVGEAGEVRHAFLHARVTHRSGRTLGLRFLGFDHDVFDRALEALAGSGVAEASTDSTGSDERGQPLTAAPPSTSTLAQGPLHRFVSPRASANTAAGGGNAAIMSMQERAAPENVCVRAPSPSSCADPPRPASAP